MVDPRVLHEVTVEMTTGFLMLAGLTVGAKLAADMWLRRFAGRFWRLDRWSRAVGTFAEPTSFVALAAGVCAAFVTMWTGSHVWPAAELWSSPTVHDKLLLVGLSTTFFLGALVLRARFRSRIWRTPTTGAFYALLVLVGNGFLVLQNSVGGHLQGTGSLLDPVLQMVNLDETVMWVFPARAALVCLVAFPLVAAVLGAKLRASNRVFARHELPPLAKQVKDLLTDARRADLGVDAPRRLIGRANLAARKGKYARAVRLLEKAKQGLAIAHPFTGTVEGVEFWTGVDSRAADGSSAFRGRARTALPGTAAGSRFLEEPTVPERSAGEAGPGSASLPNAVRLVEGSLGRFEEAPMLQVQQELRWAHAALLELKARGRDLTEPVRMLKEAHAHIVRAEWNDAIRVLERFRLEMGQRSDRDARARPKRRTSGSLTPSSDES